MSIKKAGPEGILVDGTLDEAALKKIAQLAKRTTITRISFTRVKAVNLEAVLPLVPKLADLVFYGGKVVDWAPLATAKSLRMLFCNGVAMDTALPPVFGTLGKLTELSLLHLPKLAKLDLAGCKKLARISIYGCKKLRDLGPLLALPALRDLTLVGTPHRPAELKALVALPHLKRISAHFGSRRDDEAFVALVAKHRKATDAA